MAVFGEAVELRAAVGFRQAPVGGEEAFDFEPVESRVQRTLFNAEEFARLRPDGFHDGVAVSGARMEG